MLAPSVSQFGRTLASLLSWIVVICNVCIANIAAETVQSCSKKSVHILISLAPQRVSPVEILTIFDLIYMLTFY